MEITVKRRTWPLGIFVSVSLEFNNDRVASLTGTQKKVIPISESEGQLKYIQPFDRSDQIHVKDGDVITLKETLLSKIVNILFIMTFIFMITFNLNELYTGFDYGFEGYGTLGIILFIALIVLAVVSFFFNSYKFVIENR